MTPKDPVEGFNALQKMIIKIRDEEKCQFPLCNERTNLEVHHIFPKDYAYYNCGISMVIINNMRNGITLCHQHHQQIHEGYPDKRGLVWDTTWDHYFFQQVEKNTTTMNFQETVCI